MAEFSVARIVSLRCEKVPFVCSDFSSIPRKSLGAN